MQSNSPVAHPEVSHAPLKALARLEFKALTSLALPMIVTQLSQMGMGVADAIMAGRVSPADLAGVALGGNLFWPLMLFMSGVIMALTPAVSQLHGARREAEVAAVVRQALWLALVGGGIAFLLLGYSEAALVFVGVDPAAIPIAVDYINALRWGMPPVLGYFTLRYLCEGMSWTTPAMAIALVALVLKVPLNLLFIHGAFGYPGLGGAGCGWSSALVMWFELAAMLVVVSATRMRRIGLFSSFSRPDPREIMRLVRLGLPIGATMFFEMAIFSLMTLLIGRLGVDAVAAHQIASNVGGITYMIPMSVGMAATIRVGFNVGAGNLVRARVAGTVAIGSSVLFALLAASLVLLFRDAIPLLYTNDPGVLKVATQLLLLIAIYQLFDDGQATIIGVLRGYKDTRIPLIVTLLAYWAFSLPVGAVLGFGFGTPALGVSGFWLGLILGLVLVAIVLGARFVWLSRRDELIRAYATR
jgi:multidrug resistance protein, MATE family